MPTASNNVRVRGQSGKHMLALSSSQFDPSQTLRLRCTMPAFGSSGLSSREFTSELLSWLNVTVLADSALLQLLPWLLTLSNKRPLQTVPACLAAPLGFYVRAIQLRQHLPCKKLT